MKKINFKKKITLHPIMSFIVLIFITMFISGILGHFGVSSNYIKINSTTYAYETVETSVDSLFNLAGIKYIFSYTLANFVNFIPLSTLIIALIGVGIMDKSGFLQAFLTIITKYTKRNKVTFFLILLSIIASITGEIIAVFIIPLGALLFKYGKRNPLAGIIVSYAGITSGLGANILINSIDASLLRYTEMSAKVLDPNYSISVFGTVFIMIIVVVSLSFILTLLSEKYVIPRLEKYEVEPEIEEYTVGKRELRGLVIGLGAGIIYLLFFTYNIIPGLPLSGSLLDKTQTLYIDKLFGYNSFFYQGFVFIITILFVILGLFYGIGAKTIKSNKDFSNYLSHSLDKIGKTLVLIFFASVFISVFKRTYIGNVLSAGLINLLLNAKLSGFILVIVFFIISAISAFFLPSSVLRWSIMSGVAVRVFMDAGMTPEFAQLLFRAGEALTIGITPLFAYFIIYLGFLKQYNKSEKTITILTGIRKILPYSIVTGLIWIVLIIIWFFIGIPLGINTYPFL